MISEIQIKRAHTMFKGLSLDWDAIDKAIKDEHRLSDKEIALQFGATYGQIQKRRFRVLGIRYPKGRPKKKCA